MEEDIYILSVGAGYSFQTQEGKQLEGCTMYYVMAGDLKQKEDSESGQLGYAPLKESMPLNFYDRAKANGIPCVARGTFAMRTQSGKQVLKLVGVDFVPAKK